MDSERKIKIGIGIGIILVVLYFFHLDQQKLDRVIKERDDAKSSIESLRSIVYEIQDRAQKGLEEDDEDPDYSGYLWCALDDINSMCYKAEDYHYD